MFNSIPNASANRQTTSDLSSNSGTDAAAASRAVAAPPTSHAMARASVDAGADENMLLRSNSTSEAAKKGHLLLQFEKEEAEKSYEISEHQNAGQANSGPSAASRHRRNISLGTLNLAREKADSIELEDEPVEGARKHEREPSLSSGRRAIDLERVDVTVSQMQHDEPLPSRRGGLELSRSDPVIARLGRSFNPSAVPLVMQVRPNACGDACMQMILAYHGKKHATIGSNERPIFKGMQTHDLDESLQEAGLASFSLEPKASQKCTTEDIKMWLERFGPIVCLGRGHVSVIANLTDAGVHMHDPLLGQKTISLDNLNKWIDWTADKCLLGFRAVKQKLEPGETQDASPKAPAPSAADRFMVAMLRAGVVLRDAL